MNEQQQCPTTHNHHTPPKKRTNPGPAGPWQWHMGCRTLARRAAPTMAALLHSCMAAWAGRIANSKGGSEQWAVMMIRGAEGLPVSMGAHLSCRKVAENHPHPPSPSHSQVSSWHEQQSSALLSFPLLSVSSRLHLLLASCPPAFLPASSAQPSPAQPEPEAEPFLQLMPTRSTSLSLLTSPCPTHDIITSAASSLSLCISHSQICLPDPTGWLFHRVTWPIAAGDCS